MINKLVLGTVQLGLDYGINNQIGKPSLEKAFDILHVAFDNGIRILDTAEAYGNSQDVIGKFIKANPNKKFNIISKLAANHSLKNKEILGHIKNNCEILGVNQLYGYMFHNYPSFKQNVSLIEELKLAKKQGIIKKIGISLYGNNEIEDIIDNYEDFDFIQVPFNAFDNASKRKDILKKVKNKNIEVHTRSVFLQGLFFKSSNSLPENLHKLQPYLATFKDIMIKNDIDTETLALQYVLQKEYIDHVLIGVEDENQLIKNIITCNNNIYIPHNDIDAIHICEEELINPTSWN